MVDSSSAVSWFLCPNSKRGVNIVEEAERDIPMKAFTEWEMSEYKHH